MDISIIVAVAKNGVIGKDNQMLWKLSDDLKLFKKRTSGNVVIMGRKTFDSLGKALPNRVNIVVSKNKALILDGCEIANSLEMALEMAKNKPNNKEVFVIGGEKIYQLAQAFATKLYLTKVDVEIEGDTFFDQTPYQNWEVLNRTHYLKDEKNECDFEVLEMAKVV